VHATHGTDQSETREHTPRCGASLSSETQHQRVAKPQLPLQLQLEGWLPEKCSSKHSRRCLWLSQNARENHFKDRKGLLWLRGSEISVHGHLTPSLWVCGDIERPAVASM
jgi:hypothetical protein